MSEMRIESMTDATLEVLGDVAIERLRQFRLHGDNMKQRSGTGPGVRWLKNTGVHGWTDATGIEQRVRSAYEQTWGMVTWLQIALEEFTEVAQEDDPEKLQVELIQLAAVCVSWAEKLRDPRSLAAQKGPTQA